jgi:hypothetical protein
MVRLLLWLKKNGALQNTTRVYTRQKKNGALQNIECRHENTPLYSYCNIQKWLAEISGDMNLLL